MFFSFETKNGCGNWIQINTIVETSKLKEKIILRHFKRRCGDSIPGSI